MNPYLELASSCVLIAFGAIMSVRYFRLQWRYSQLERYWTEALVAHLRAAEIQKVTSTYSALRDGKDRGKP